MGRKVSDGRSIRVKTSAKVNAGEFAEIQGFFGLAIQTAPAGEELVLNCEQAEYETSQIDETLAFSKGAEMYWDSAAKLFTTDAAADASGNPVNRPVGRVTVAKDANNVIWFQLAPQTLAH